MTQCWVPWVFFFALYALDLEVKKVATWKWQKSADEKSLLSPAEDKEKGRLGMDSVKTRRATFQSNNTRADSGLPHPHQQRLVGTLDFCLCQVAPGQPVALLGGVKKSSRELGFSSLTAGNEVPNHPWHQQRPHGELNFHPAPRYLWGLARNINLYYSQAVKRWYTLCTNPTSPSPRPHPLRQRCQRQSVTTEVSNKIPSLII